MTFNPHPPKKQKNKNKNKSKTKQNKNGFEIFKMGEKIVGCGCNYWHE